MYAATGGLGQCGREWGGGVSAASPPRQLGHSCHNRQLQTAGLEYCLDLCIVCDLLHCRDCLLCPGQLYVAHCTGRNSLLERFRNLKLYEFIFEATSP